MNIRPVTAEFFHADGQTDGLADRHDEANSRCSQFCESVQQVRFAWSSELCNKQMPSTRRLIKATSQRATRLMVNLAPGSQTALRSSRSECGLISSCGTELA